MINTLIDDIILYIEFLKKEYGLHITLHDKIGFLSRHIHRLVPYNIHSNPYCLCVKSNKALWDKCIYRQEKVFERCSDGIFFGMCYAGIEEYVVPIENKTKILGFISVSGYSSDKAKAMERINYLCNEYFIDKKNITDIYNRSLEKHPPSIEFIKSTISTLSRLLELLYIKSIDLFGESKITNKDIDYIFGHILAFIEQNYRAKIYVSDISKACHCSISYVSHIFIKKTGCNISTYINNLRVKEAKRLLSMTNLSIQEISYTVGFADSNYFSSTFKKICNISPREYRNSINELV